MNRYKYSELLQKATRKNATQEDVDRLVEWFQQYGDQYWNGEYFDADGYQLRPVYGTAAVSILRWGIS